MIVMDDNDVVYCVKYIKNDLKVIRDQIDFLLMRIEESEKKHGLNKQKKKELI